MERRFPLYRPDLEHDACGVGFVANVSGRRSFQVLDMALQSVTNLTHRGAVDADAKTGDGAGVMVQVPQRFFRAEAERLGARVDAGDDLAVGVVFLPRRHGELAGRCRAALESAARGNGLCVIGWREVPVDPTVLGDLGASTRPRIEQLLLGRASSVSGDEFERLLYLTRKDAEAWARREGVEDFYIPSLSHRTLVYKGLFVAHQLNKFYQDLANPAFETALAVFHQRYSTNTFPNWVLAQPFRLLAHNGEINTLQGNRVWTRAREPELRSAVWGAQIERLKPVVQEGGSDSASLDNILESVVLSGRDVLHAVMMLIPEAWENMPNMRPEWRSFYEYHACLSEPWDGPASIAFSDGVVVGATLDRNGLRPARYVVTEDGLIVMGSEVGMAPLDDSRIVQKGRLGPGQMIAVDTARQALLTNDAIKDEVAARRPYGEWVGRRLVHLGGCLSTSSVGSAWTEDELLRQQVAFGFTREELRFVLRPMAGEAKEPVGSMGDDTALAVLESRPRPDGRPSGRLLYSYFKQKFAQVTNPAIDPIREELVMSLDTYLGRRRSFFEEGETHAELLRLTSPLIVNEQLAALRSLENFAFRAATLPVLFPAADGSEGLERALRSLCEAASRAVDDGCSILVLSDRGVDAASAAIPMLLAVGAVHHHLIEAGKRMRASIVAETGEARDVHQIALLIGYGASAVNPYLAFESVAALFDTGDLKNVNAERALSNYQAAVDAGLLKIMSKMGISTISAYHGGRVFEAVGLSREVTDLCFGGTPSRIGGIGFPEIGEDVLERHRRAFGRHPDLHLDGVEMDEGGFYRYRRDGEYHAFNPEVVRALHHSVDGQNGYDSHKKYSRLVQSRDPIALRDLMAFRKGQPVPIDEVEPAEAIMRRFNTSAMSLGALSPEAHETLAIAMNRIGAKSNTGEGGEEAHRFWQRRSGNNPNCAVKQVASGRFGVTPAYLAAAQELEIKIAQGSKPGEGGQLPGHKVSPYIATIRHTLPGTPLISPPPHHDIYSIEDLAQLIYDLKQANPRARVCVKLVAEEGVGTIAAGVAKAYADVIHISGQEGGTGASPLSSIKFAGVPWELGLAEAQQVLVLNDLRSRVTLRTDGGLRTGRDVVIAAMLGAEEYGFGTAALLAVGCLMARQCHLNTCPAGVATQREDLRARYRGTPEMVIRFFTHIAQEVREILAEMGFRRLEEVIGRTDLLEQVKGLAGRAATLDLTSILTPADPTGERPRRCLQERNQRADRPLDEQIISDARDALEGNGAACLLYDIHNQDRAIGTRLAGEIARRYGDGGLPAGTIQCHLRGSAGQSFGAFLTRGVRLVLTGEANDYVGKGMGGGEIAIRPPAESKLRSHENVIIGNTVLYGATGGTLYAAGRAGERFAVRNSGAKAVVEGVGDHGCEYMTEGVVAILGKTGRNFGAGMSNGVAYVLDEDGLFPSRLNPEMVNLARLRRDEDIEMLRALIRRHVQLTGSERGRDILERWEHFLPLFWKVAPQAAMTEDGPRTVVHRHLESIRELAGVR